VTAIDASWTHGDAGESDQLRDDGLPIYRYWIERSWSARPRRVLWVMFNPSRATGTDDNNGGALRLCVRRTKQMAIDDGLDVGGLRIVNLFARRATNIAAEGWPKGDWLNNPAWIATAILTTLDETNGHETVYAEPYYAQIASDNSYGLHLEVVSNEYVEGPDRLTGDQEAHLLTLGWEAPDLTEGLPNYWRQVPKVVHAFAADLVVQTLRYVHRCPAGGLGFSVRPTSASSQQLVSGTRQ
jgi:hypothetical protein